MQVAKLFGLEDIRVTEDEEPSLEAGTVRVDIAIRVSVDQTFMSTRSVQYRYEPRTATTASQNRSGSVFPRNRWATR